MSTAGNYTFNIDKGTTIKFEVQYKYCDNTPVDLTDYSAQMRIIKDCNGDYNNYYESCGCDDIQQSNIIGIDYPFIISSSILPDGTGITFNGLSGLLPSSSGALAVTISQQTSSLFNFDVAKYQLDLYKDNDVIRLLVGNINVIKQIENYV